MDLDRSTSSERFLKAVDWLDSQLKFNQQELKTRIEEMEEQLTKASGGITVGAGQTVQIRPSPRDQIKWQLDDLKKRVELKYRCQDAEAIYILKKINSKAAEEFVSAAGNVAFWQDAMDILVDDPHILWFLEEIGLENNGFFLEFSKDLAQEQSVQGLINSNEFSHAGPLRVFVATAPESDTTLKALDYWLENWKETVTDVGTISVGILALAEQDNERYLDAIKEEVEYLKRLQNDDGSWGMVILEPYSKQGNIKNTSFAVWAISKINHSSDEAAMKGLKWLAEKQEKDGSWEHNWFLTTYALLALLAAGEGPKISVELANWEHMRTAQRVKRQKAQFVHTSPIFQGSLHKKEIYSEILKMLRSAKKEIRIASPFIDMLYEEIIDLKQENPTLSVKIIIRPKKEAEGLREKIAKNVIDILNIASKGNVVQSDLIHARIIIVDDEEVLVSSADLTRDQLFDEFNAGISTRDKETVKKATDFFENIFAMEKKQS